MKLYDNIRELLLISVLVLMAAGCTKNQSPKAVPLVLPAEIGQLYDELGFEYAGLKEAEEELLAMRDSAGLLPGDKLLALLSNDPTSYDYDFPVLSDSSDFYLSTSADRNLRLFGWKTGEVDGMAQWDNVIQFKTPQGPYVYHGSIMDFSGMESQNVGPLGNVPTLELPDGTIGYMLRANWPETADIMCCMIVPVQIGERELLPLQLFPADSTATDGRNSSWCRFSLRRWKERTGINDSKGIYAYDRNFKTTYVPIIEGVDPTDRFNLYAYENGSFVNVGEDGGYWLHPSIRNFKRLEVFFATPQFMVRIDRMPDDSYRYASWSDETVMIGQPDIILYNGSYNSENNSYTFTNGSYEYRVQPWAKEDELTAYENGKKILSETRIQ